LPVSGLCLAGNGDSSNLVDAAAAEKVMVVPGHLISVKHLQAAFARKMQLHDLANQERRLQVQRKQESVVKQVQQQLHVATGAAAACCNSADEEQLEVDIAAQAAVEAGEDEAEICSYFRVSFVSVGPEQLRQGFARLKLAIPNCQTEPKTPDGKDA
jgi:hypothetical protein